jgi:hypothetical protein
MLGMLEQSNILFFGLLIIVIKILANSQQILDHQGFGGS